MSKHWTRQLFAAVLASLGLGLSSSASASPLFELTGSTFGSGGLSSRATGPSSASTYFNPALLPKAKQGLEVGWLVLNDAIDITLHARSRAADIPSSAIGRFGTDAPSFPTDWLENGCSPATGACSRDVPQLQRQGAGSSHQVRAYQAIGLVNHIFKDYLSLGFYALVPLSSFTHVNSFFVDEREQFFSNSLHPELYSDRLTPVSLSFGVGSRLTDWMSVGLSLTLNLVNEANAGAYVGNSDQLADTLQLATKVDVSAGVSPHLALLFEPLKQLDLSLTLHSPQQMVVETAFGIFLPNGDIQNASRRAVHSWLPWTLGLGAGYDVFETERNQVALTASLTFERWSQYVNRMDERPLRNYEWSDTVTGVLGVRYVRDNRLSTFLDLSFRPSPVPEQTGRTNYVDNDRYSIAAGVTYELPVRDTDLAFRFGGQAQLHILPEREQKKYDPSAAPFSGKKYSQLVLDEWPDETTDISTGQVIAEAQGLQTNNPGWPGYSSGGYIVGGALSVALLY